MKCALQKNCLASGGRKGQNTVWGGAFLVLILRVSIKPFLTWPLPHTLWLVTSWNWWLTPWQCWWSSVVNNTPRNEKENSISMHDRWQINPNCLWSTALSELSILLKPLNVAMSHSFQNTLYSTIHPLYNILYRQKIEVNPPSPKALCKLTWDHFSGLNWWCQSWVPELVERTSWLVEQIDVRPRRVELSWRGSPDACLSASEWTGIYYLSPLPTIKPIMSCFNSLGKQAYRSHVSINVNYPGSCPWLRVHQPPQSWPPVAPAWNPICLMSMLHQVRNAMRVVQKIKAARPSLGGT